MRLFTGIAIPSAITDNLKLLLERLRPTARISWSPPANFHITTKFIGEWPEDRLPELNSALSSLQAHPSMQIAVSGIGWLPNPHSPRVLFAAIKAGPELAALAAATEAVLEPLGLEREERAFKPHLTLARIKDRAIPLGPLRSAIAELESTDFGSFTADRFHLYHSKPGPSGSVYTQLGEFPLSIS